MTNPDLEDEPEFYGYGFFEAPDHYFSTDRLVGVFDSDEEDQPSFLIELVHLTSRFGMFLRSNNKWSLITPDWGINPEYKYINFKKNKYKKIINLFDESFNEQLPDENALPLEYEDVSQFRDLTNWETTFYNTSGPRELLDIKELINQARYFIDPKPTIFRLKGTIFENPGQASKDEWEDASCIMGDLENERSNYELLITMALNKKRTEIEKEGLAIIQMYPPLQQSVLDLRDQIMTLIGVRKLTPQLEELYEYSTYENYLEGGSISIENLLIHYSLLLKDFINYSSSPSQAEIKEIPVSREVSIMPSSRLEIWVINNEPNVLVANTVFGQYLRRDKRWQPRGPLDEITEEDLYTLAQPQIAHLQAENFLFILSHFDSIDLRKLSIDSPEITQFQVHYKPNTIKQDSESVNFGSFWPRLPNFKLNYEDADELSKKVLLDIYHQIKSDYDFLLQSHTTPHFELKVNLEDGIRDFIDFMYNSKIFDLNSIQWLIYDFIGHGFMNLKDLVESEKELINENIQKEKNKLKGRVALLKKASESTSGFGPGYFSFILDLDSLISDLIIDTDIGVFFLDRLHPNFSDFPLWSIWDFQEDPKKIYQKFSVLIGQKHTDSAIRMYLEALKINENLTREDVLSFWQDHEADEIPESERLIWYNQSRKISELPFEIQYLGKWAQSFIEKFVKEDVHIDSWVSMSLFKLFLDDSLAFNRDQVLIMFYIFTNPVLASSKSLDKKQCESLLKPIYEKITKEVGITPYDSGDDIAVSE